MINYRKKSTLAYQSITRVLNMFTRRESTTVLNEFNILLRNIMWGMFIAGGVMYTLQNIQENTLRYLEMKTRTEVIAERNKNKGKRIKPLQLYWP